MKGSGSRVLSTSRKAASGEQFDPHSGAVAEPEEKHATVWVSVGSWGFGVRTQWSGAGGKGLRVRI